MKKPLLFIDTDMGVDDIVAICMLIASRRFDMGGISTVNGVSSVREAGRNLARILTYLGIAVPLYRGIDQQTQNSSIQFPPVDRLRAKTLALLPNTPLLKRQPKIRSLSQLQNDLSYVTQPVTVLCLGPLSNVAYLLEKPTVARKIAKLVIMGGAINVPGNVAPGYVAEYNIRLDPKAADRVLRSGIPTILVPIDATRFVPASTENPVSATFLETVKRIRTATRIGKIIRKIIIENDGDFQQFYDPLAAAILIDPKIASSTSYRSLEIITRGQNIGRIIRTNHTKRVTVINEINAKRFYRSVIELIRQ